MIIRFIRSGITPQFFYTQTADMIEKQTINITVIGGGSVNWMKNLMRDVYQLDSASGGEIRLVDPNIPNAQAVAGMLEKFNELCDKSYTISVHARRKDALKNADFVLCTFSPGAMHSFYNDLEIPIRYGIRQPVSMTVGPCGSSAALRTCYEAYDLVLDMEADCPGALLLNVTNPMTAVTRAMNMAAKTVKVIGMCHEFHNLGKYVGPAIGLEKPDDMPILEYLYLYLPKQGFDYDVAGINHFIWLTRASLDGKDMLPVIREYAREKLLHPGIAGQEDIQAARQNFGKYTLCDIFGHMPLVGDRHLIEFIPSMCNQRTGWGMEYGVRKTMVPERVLGKERSLRQIQDITTGKQQVNWNNSGEEMTAIMNAHITGQSTIGIMNLPNQGQISNLPEDCVVETLADFHTGAQIAPRKAGNLPRSIAAMCRLQLEIIETVIQASLHGDRELFIEALALDPLCADASLGQIKQLADELLYANRYWLNRFYPDVDRSEKSEPPIAFYF